MKTSKTIQFLDSTNSNISPTIGIESIFYEQETNGSVKRIPVYQTMPVDVRVQIGGGTESGQRLSLVSLSDIAGTDGTKRLEVVNYPISKLVAESEAWKSLDDKIPTSLDVSGDVTIHVDDMSNPSNKWTKVNCISGDYVDSGVLESYFSDSSFAPSSVFDDPKGGSAKPLSNTGGLYVIKHDEEFSSSYTASDARYSYDCSNMFMQISPRLMYSNRDMDNGIFATTPYDASFGIRFIAAPQGNLTDRDFEVSSVHEDRIAVSKTFWTPKLWTNQLRVKNSIMLASNSFNEYSDSDPYIAHDQYSKFATIKTDNYLSLDSDGAIKNISSLTKRGPVVLIENNKYSADNEYFSTNGKIVNWEQQLMGMIPAMTFTFGVSSKGTSPDDATTWTYDANDFHFRSSSLSTSQNVRIYKSNIDASNAGNYVEYKPWIIGLEFNRIEADVFIDSSLSNLNPLDKIELMKQCIVVPEIESYQETTVNGYKKKGTNIRLTTNAFFVNRENAEKIKIRIRLFI